MGILIFAVVVVSISVALWPRNRVGLWVVNEDDCVFHWCVAGTAEEAVAQAEEASMGANDERLYGEVVARRVYADEARRLSFDDDGEDMTMLAAMRKHGRGYLGCSEW